MDQPCRHFRHCRQHFAQHYGGVQQADQRLPPLGRCDRIGARPENRHEKQEAGAAAAVLHQRDGGGEGWQPAVHGTLDRLPADRLGAEVQAQRQQVGHRGLDVLDDVEIVVVERGQLAHCELRCLVALLGRHESRQGTAQHALDKAEATQAGKFLRQVARFDVGPKVAPRDLLTCGKQAHRASEPEDRTLDARDDDLGHAGRTASKVGACLRIVPALQPQAGAGSDATAQQRQRHRRKARQTDPAPRCQHDHPLPSRPRACTEPDCPTLRAHAGLSRAAPWQSSRTGLGIAASPDGPPWRHLWSAPPGLSPVSNGLSDGRPVGGQIFGH